MDKLRKYSLEEALNREGTGWPALDTHHATSSPRDSSFAFSGSISRISHRRSSGISLKLQNGTIGSDLTMGHRGSTFTDNLTSSPASVSTVPDSIIDLDLVTEISENFEQKLKVNSGDPSSRSSRGRSHFGDDEYRFPSYSKDFSSTFDTLTRRNPEDEHLPTNEEFTDEESTCYHFDRLRRSPSSDSILLDNETDDNFRDVIDNTSSSSRRNIQFDQGNQSKISRPLKVRRRSLLKIWKIGKRS